MQYTTFISHSNKDSEIVCYIASQLQSFGITPIIAENIRPESFPQYLADKIRKLIQKFRKRKQHYNYYND